MSIPGPHPLRTQPERPARPVLRPGLRVFRRDDRHVQVGLDDPRTVLTDTADVRDLLRRLESGEGLATLSPEAGLALERLAEGGLLVDRDEVAEVAAGHDREAARAAYAAHGAAAGRRVAARRASRIAVTGPDPWHSALTEALSLGGLTTPGPGRSPLVTVLVSTGEPPRSLLDGLVRDDRPHLVVTLLPDSARVGPLVVPGTTACLRCVDAHRAEEDPRRGLVLEQLESPPATPPPCDPLLGHAALALAAADLASYVEGDEPGSWSATVTLGPGLTLRRRSWHRHPHCGCSWA